MAQNLYFLLKEVSKLHERRCFDCKYAWTMTYTLDPSTSGLKELYMYIIMYPWLYSIFWGENLYIYTRNIIHCIQVDA